MVVVSHMVAGTCAAVTSKVFDHWTTICVHHNNEETCDRIKMINIMKHAHAWLSSSAASVSQCPSTRKEGPSFPQHHSRCSLQARQSLSHCVRLCLKHVRADQAGSRPSNAVHKHLPEHDCERLSLVCGEVSSPAGAEQPHVPHLSCTDAVTLCLLVSRNEHGCLNHRQVLAIGRLSTTFLLTWGAQGARSAGSPGSPMYNSAGQDTGKRQRQARHTCT